MEKRRTCTSVEGHSRARRYAGGILYALRHSSIVRGLRKGLPIQQVAKLHNTSVKISNDTTLNTLRPPWKTSQGRRSCPWCRGVMETWCQWENACKKSYCGLDRIHSSEGAGSHADEIRTKLAPLISPRALPEAIAMMRRLALNLREWGYLHFRMASSGRGI